MGSEISLSYFIAYVVLYCIGIFHFFKNLNKLFKNVLTYKYMCVNIDVRNERKLVRDGRQTMR